MAKVSQVADHTFDTPHEIDLPRTASVPDFNDPSDRIVRLIRLFVEHRRLLVRNLLIGIFGFAMLAFLIPNQYESTAKLMPPDQNKTSGLALLSALTSSQSSPALGLASEMLGVKSSGAVFVGILQSRTIQDDLVRHFDLRHVYSVKTWEDARKKLGRRTDVSEDRKSGIIDIKVSDNTRERAQALAQGYVDELNRLVALLTTSSAHRERVFLEERLKDVKQDLDAAAVSFSKFASNNTAIDIPAQGKAMVEAAAELQGQLIAAESQLSELEQIYTSSNVRVRSLKARVEELQRQLEKVGGKDVNGETKDLNVDGSTPNTIDSLYPSIRKLPLLGVQYSDLYRRVKIEETVYEVLTKQYELAKVEEAKEIPTVRVLDLPEIPERKSSPPRLLIIVFGAVWFTGMTGLWLVAKQAWERREPHDPLRMLAQEIHENLALPMRARAEQLSFRRRKISRAQDS